MHTPKLAATAAVFASAVIAQSSEDVFGLAPCSARCYQQTAQLIGCSSDDFPCLCRVWDIDFRAQYTSCLIEGCIGSPSTITVDELKQRVCSEALVSNSTASWVSTGTTVPTGITASNSGFVTDSPNATSSPLTSTTTTFVGTFLTEVNPTNSTQQPHATTTGEAAESIVKTGTGTPSTDTMTSGLAPSSPSVSASVRLGMADIKVLTACLVAAAMAVRVFANGIF
ncbi:hypothetical protein CFIMG_005892RA [Ceratocystis fimbriata CBS 114723]|uniref:CFEM domain-containing protein n=1 Tax=Ceratocystis fimbriata CBS 114723 TaxID=1035309 RepID=A0A2C5WW04_9PEZI|nr:hypothetical protein CFIMG_005892RA [Ceratocystis fimbriata CBS 114723]